MNRKVLKDFTFSNGTVLPAGTFLSVASYATHHDEANYAHPNEFDPFRFAQLRDQEGEEIRHQMVSTNSQYLSFGHGKHAWYTNLCLSGPWSNSRSSYILSPGRFFAITELKAMLAHVLVTYDVKFQNEGVRPPNQWFGTTSLPNRNAEIMFRKRFVEGK